VFEGLSDGALVAAFVVIVIREILGFLRDRAAASQFDNMKAAVYSTEHLTKELHLWHAKEDDEGRKVWYGKKSLEKVIEQLAQNVADQNTIFIRFADKFESYDSKIAAMRLEQERKGNLHE